jgi:hypothetical protein
MVAWARRWVVMDDKRAGSDCEVGSPGPAIPAARLAGSLPLLGSPPNAQPHCPGERLAINLTQTLSYERGEMQWLPLGKSTISGMRT